MENEKIKKMRSKRAVVLIKDGELEFFSTLRPFFEGYPCSSTTKTRITRSLSHNRVYNNKKYTHESIPENFLLVRISVLSNNEAPIRKKNKIIYNLDNSTVELSETKKKKHHENSSD